MICIKVDKSQNINKIIPSECNKILHKKITDKYKIDHQNTVNRMTQKLPNSLTN